MLSLLEKLKQGVGWLLDVLLQLRESLKQVIRWLLLMLKLEEISCGSSVQLGLKLRLSQI